MNNPSSNKTTNRFLALDGLRGLAILLVFLNHVDPHYIITAFPILDKIGLFSSGVTGVTFLFILSGFLIAYIYPNPQNPWEFIQKRYIRIFPLFLCMNVFMFILFKFPTLPWYGDLFALLSIAGVIHIVWVYGIKKIKSQTLAKILFFSFLILQIVIGGLYAFWIMRRPPIYFQTLPVVFRDGLIILTNLTLMFPLGNYIPMLDGVYWALATEILFYVLYPFVVVPIITIFTNKKLAVKLLFLLALIPFLAGIDRLSHHLFVLSALQPNLFYYFSLGIALVFFYKHYRSRIQHYSEGVSSIVSNVPLFLFAFIIIVIHVLDSVTPDYIGPWIRLGFAIPMTILIATAFDTKTVFARFLQNKWLLYLGSISYSVYLCHAAVIIVFESVFKSVNVTTNILFILGSFLITVIIAKSLNFLLERPYSSSSLKVHNIEKTKTMHGKVVMWIILLTSLVGIFFAYQSAYGFSSISVPISKSTILEPSVSKNQRYISLETYLGLTFRFTAMENNLGIIDLPVAEIVRKKSTIHPFLTFSIFANGNKYPLVTQTYGLDEFKGIGFPFGFPVITNSKNQTYTVRFSQMTKVPQEYAQVHIDNMKAIYQINIKEFIQHPSLLLAALKTKLEAIFSNTEAVFSLALLTPLLLLNLFLIFT